MHVLTLCGAVLVGALGCRPPVDPAVELTPDEDALALERRAAELGLSLEIGALARLSGEVARSVRARGELDYLAAVVAALESAPVEGEPLSLPRYAVRNSIAGWEPEHEFGADSWNAAEADRLVDELRPTARIHLGRSYPTVPPVLQERGVESVPVLWAPSTEAIDEALTSLEVDVESILEDAPRTSYPHAFGLYFDPLPEIPARLRGASVPTPTRGAVRHVFDPNLQLAIDPLQVGKVIAHAEGGRAAARVVDDHRRRVAECVAVEIVPGLYATRWTLTGDPPRQQWVIPVADANGAARIERLPVEGGRSWYENELFAVGLEERFGRHSDLVVPRPRPTEPRTRADHVEQEQIAIPVDRLADAGGVVVLSKAPTWRPLQPDYVLTQGLDEPRDAPQGVLAVVLSVHASTPDLLTALGRVSGRRPELGEREQDRLSRLRSELVR